MSKMQELYEKVAKDSVLQAKVFEILKNAEKAGEDATEKLISFAKDAGYDITPDEMKEFFSKFAESEQGALSDAELDMVAGGKSGRGILTVVFSVIGLGISCAILSLSEELDAPGACGDKFN